MNLRENPAEQHEAMTFEELTAQATISDELKMRLWIQMRPVEAGENGEVRRRFVVHYGLNDGVIDGVNEIAP